jgi:hypothetical protein
MGKLCRRALAPLLAHLAATPQADRGGSEDAENGGGGIEGGQKPCGGS